MTGRERGEFHSDFRSTSFVSQVKPWRLNTDLRLGITQCWKKKKYWTGGWRWSKGTWRGRKEDWRYELNRKKPKLSLMLATFALEWRSNYPLVFGASVPRSQQPLGPCRHRASRASCLPNTCRYTGRTNSPTTREPDERAGNCCQKPWKDLCKDEREMLQLSPPTVSYLPV